MADTLESLEIEVKHKASGADSEIAKVNAQIEAMGKALQSVLPQLKQYADTLSKIGGKIKASVPKAPAAQANPLPEDLQAAISSASQVDVLQAKLESLHTAMQEAFSAGDADKALALRGQILQTEAALSKAGAAAEKAGKATQEAGKGMKEMAKEASKSKSPLENIISSLKRIAFYRMIRSVLKSITQAFKEGLQNAYTFSAGITGEGHRFAAAMDSMKTAGSVMKNQLGAAFIGLLTAIAPIVTQIINLVIKLANAISQIFAVFTGDTYLKAAEVPQKWGDAAGGAAKAAKEWKNQLLGFDEINRLEEPSDPSGGGGGGSVDPMSLFKDSPIEAWVYRLKEKIQPIIEDIKLMFHGLIDFITGVFTGNWDLAFQGLGEILVGFGNLVNDVLNGIVLPVFDGFSQKIIEIIGSLFDWISEKTGIDMSFWKENILFQLNFVRFAIEGFAIQVGWVVQDLCNLVSAILTGDWDKAWESAQKLVKDASANILPTVFDMAKQVTDEMMGVSNEVSKHSRSSHSSVASASAGIANDVIGAGNASATFAETFAGNMDAIRTQMSAMGQSSLTLNDTGNSLSFTARVMSAISSIKRAFAASNTEAGNWGLFANGGFPDEGSLYFAGERGPELVGTMGGRNAVANNDQIVEGIRQGVYDAVSAAMANNGTSEPVVRVYLDSREIKSGQNRLNRALGVG